MLRRVVGLEIGPESIRAVQIRRTSFGKIIVEKYVEAAAGSGVDANGKILNSEALSRQLKSVWAIAKFKSKHVALGVGGNDVFVREFSVPEMKPEALQGTLPSLAEGSLPMPTTELILDFYPSQNLENSNPAMVSGLLLAATKASTNSLVSAVQGAGLIPEAIDLVPFSVLRQLQQQRKADSVVSIVHASAGYLNVIVANGHVPKFIRMVPLPSLKKNQNQEVGQAQASKEDQTLESSSSASELSEEDPILLGDDFEATSTEFQEAAIRELKETLAYYVRTHPEEPIATLFTSGKGLDNSDWLTLLGQQIWLPTESHTQTELQQIDGQAKKVHRAEVPTEYLVPLSLAKGVINAR